ncbi:MAG: hypothetical protein KF713_00410 [Turneriella sp.]|nr:hypothetical protein [Turneriella sp.]
MLQTIRNHGFLSTVLAIAAAFYIIFPLQLQSMEAYSYAAGIEKYYNLSSTFALAQGQHLPDFGRYHLNHPLGHVLAGLAFDALKIPAHHWMRFTNIISALAAALFLYLFSLRLRLSKNVSTLACALFLATHAALLAVFSGEWHMPSLALSLAGAWQILLYWQENKTRNLNIAALLLCIAVCYHTAALSFSVCLSVALILTRWKNLRKILTAGAVAGAIIIIVYFVLPFFILRFESFSDFWRTFFIYKYLTHVRYGAFDWFLVAIQTLFHSFFFIPATLPVMNWFAIPFFIAMIAACWRFFRSHADLPVKLFFIFMLVGWPAALAIVGTRANGLNGLIFMLPLICVIVAQALHDLHRRAILIGFTLPVILVTWNFYHLILPNHLHNRDDIFLFKPPRQIPATTPVAFIAGELVLTIGEIWHAGSELDFRNQAVFYPCCGEDSYLFRLRRWLRANPGAVIVSDAAPELIERFLQGEGLQYVRWLDRQVNWPASLIPATLYFKRDPDYQYHKRLIIWLPPEKVPLR